MGDDQGRDCARAKTGYPEVGRPTRPRAAFLKRLAYENCVEGTCSAPGEAANLSIGQGDVLVTPLQLAVAYAAIVGDGKLRSPRVGWAIVAPGRHAGQGDHGAGDRASCRWRRGAALHPQGAERGASDGTAAGAFQGFPFDKVNVGGKTGTAEVYGKEDTSWFASFAPAENPRFVVVVMVSQGGMGAETAAPAARRIYEGIYGIGTAKQAALPRGRARRPGCR